MLPADVTADGLPLWFLKVSALLVGACFGSFANVVIYRVPLNKSIVRPGSACPNCGHEIKWYENIPIVSWLFLRGKCSGCRGPISIRYPLVELMMAVLSLAALMVGLARVGGMDVTAGQVAALWFFPFALCFLLVNIIFIDFEHWIIPHVLTIIGIVLGLAYALLISDPAGGVKWYESLIGIAAGALPIVAIIEIYFRVTGREGMGYGDVMLMAMAGAWFGYIALPFILLASSIQGLMVTIPMLVARRRTTPPWQADGTAGTTPESSQEQDAASVTESSQEQDTPSVTPVTTSARHMAIPFGPFIGLSMLEWLFFHDVITSYFFGF